MSEYHYKQEFDDRYAYLNRRLSVLQWTMRALVLGTMALTIYLASRLGSMFILVVGFGAAVWTALALRKRIYEVEDETRTLKSYAAAAILDQRLSPLKRYDPFAMMDRKEIEHVVIPVSWEEITGSDLVEGVYKGVPLRFSDVKMVSFIEDGQGEVHEQTAFGGQVFTLRMKSSIKGKVWIGRFADNESSILSQAAYEKRIGGAVMSVAALEKQSVFASNAEAAAELLTDGYAGKLGQALGRGDGRLFLCFDGDTLFGAKDCRRDLFENKYEMDWETMTKTDQRELDSFLELIDCLTDDPALFDRESGGPPP